MGEVREKEAARVRVVGEVSEESTVKGAVEGREEGGTASATRSLLLKVKVWGEEQEEEEDEEVEDEGGAEEGEGEEERGEVRECAEREVGRGREVRGRVEEEGALPSSTVGQSCGGRVAGGGMAFRGVKGAGRWLRVTVVVAVMVVLLGMGGGKSAPCRSSALHEERGELWGGRMVGVGMVASPSVERTRHVGVQWVGGVGRWRDQSCVVICEIQGELMTCGVCICNTAVVRWGGTATAVQL